MIYNFRPLLRSAAELVVVFSWSKTCLLGGLNASKPFSPLSALSDYAETALVNQLGPRFHYNKLYKEEGANRSEIRSLGKTGNESSAAIAA